MKKDIAPFLLSSFDYSFPATDLALDEPNGLLAIGGDLQPERLLNAYRQGIFPWYSDNQPLLWWSPNPRNVLFPQKLVVSRSLKKVINKNLFEIRYDSAFRDVISACGAQPRPEQDGTWITDMMIDAYCQLHEQGFAHSIEAWQDNKLVGGLYGIAIGKIFFGESMFTTVNDASKVAFVHLVKRLQELNFLLIDCQMQTDHLDRFGAENISRSHFSTIIGQGCQLTGHHHKW